MAKGMYVGVADKARKVKSIYVGVDGKARKVKKVYVGDANGKARLCWSAEPAIKIKTGTFTKTSGTSHTISGLSFKPTGIFVIGINVAHANGYYPTIIPPTGNWRAAQTNGVSSFTSSSITTNISYGTNSVTLSFSTSYSGRKFNGEYHYIIWGEE